MSNGTSGLINQMSSVERIIALVIVLILTSGSGLSVAKYVQTKPVDIEKIATKQDIKEAVSALNIDKFADADHVDRLEKLYEKNSELIRQTAETVNRLIGYIEAKSEKKLGSGK